MAENSKIEWTHHTFNPWMGCTKVSPACANCYAERDFDHRYGKVRWGPNGTRVVTSEANWRKPIHWNAEAERLGVRKRVFCASLADVFEDWQGVLHRSNGDVVTCRVSGIESDMASARRRLFYLIDKTPHLDWLLLTKRPENVRRMWPGGCRNNVWLGCSVENQEFADKRIPELLNCRNHSPVLFLSCEPVVGPIDLSTWLGRKTCFARNEDGVMKSIASGIDWAITGGESGPNARPADPNWFRSLRDQCVGSGVKFHFKQWGEYDEHQVRVGKKNAGRLLDGVEWNQIPDVREVPL